MFLGTISGLTFGVLEDRLYTELAIAQVANAHAVSQADAGVLDFAFRVFVDGFEYAILGRGIRIFIGIAINCPRRRWQFILLGISMVAVLNGLNDWSVSSFSSYWPEILIQAVSLLLFPAIRCRRRRSRARSGGHRCSGVTRSTWTRTASIRSRPGRPCS
jgi:hypothetical protein